jgi:hypothetical protein
MPLASLTDHASFYFWVRSKKRRRRWVKVAIVADCFLYFCLATVVNKGLSSDTKGADQLLYSAYSLAPFSVRGKMRLLKNLCQRRWHVESALWQSAALVIPSLPEDGINK